MIEQPITYTEATVCLPVYGDQVLLAEKQKKVGAGFLNGFGGKMELGDATLLATNARETQEEVGLTVTAAHKVAEITFHNPMKDETLNRIRVHFFIATEWLGEPVGTKEMRKPDWYDIASLDYERFLPADRLFMPHILTGSLIRGLIVYNDDWSIASTELTEVDRF